MIYLFNHDGLNFVAMLSIFCIVLDQINQNSPYERNSSNKSKLIVGNLMD